jgi:hypothetical protein
MAGKPALVLDVDNMFGIVPPAMLFSDEERIKTIDDILRHSGSSSFFGMNG